MRLESLQMRGSVEINKIFSLNWRCYGPKRDILDYWGTLIFHIFPIIPYQWINVYRVERMNIGNISLTN